MAGGTDGSGWRLEATDSQLIAAGAAQQQQQQQQGQGQQEDEEAEMAEYDDEEEEGGLGGKGHGRNLKQITGEWVSG